MPFERPGERHTIMRDSKGEKKGRSMSKGQECTDREPEEDAPHPEGIWGVSGQLSLMLCWETLEEKGMDIGTMVTRILHQASSFFCCGWWGKSIRKSHDSLRLQMGKVLRKTNKQEVWKVPGEEPQLGCVYVAMSLDGRQWSGILWALLSAQAAPRRRSWLAFPVGHGIS